MPTPSPLRSDPFGRRAPWPLAPAGLATPLDPTRECYVQATEQFWLRPYPTFEHTGRRLPEGTGAIVEAYTPHVQGNLRLWRIRGTETGTVGYAAFTERGGEVQGFESIEGNCAAVAVDNTPLRGGASPANPARPQTVTTPAAPVAPRAPAAGSSTGKQVALLAGLAGLGALGVYAWRKSQRGKRR